MLAYVFWHWPSPSVDSTVYRKELLAFHRMLAAHPSEGLQGSRVWSVTGAPWLPIENAFEDWYLVEDFTALGKLNEAAVAGRRRDPHDSVARLVGGGVGGVYRRLTEGNQPLERVSWLTKPSGMGYAVFLARMPPGVELWQRQMVLGPAPEFCLGYEFAPVGPDGVNLSIQRLYP